MKNCIHQDFMIDLETLSTLPNAHILSVGVVDMNNHDNTFYCTVDGNSQDHRHREFGTMKWWMKQSPEAQKAATSRDQMVTLEEMLHGIRFFVEDHNLTHPWANGSVFDVIILENAYREAGIEIPWKFWNVRDTRTIYDMAYRITGKTLKPQREGTYHNALDDAIFQSEWVRDIRSVIEP